MSYETTLTIITFTDISVTVTIVSVCTGTVITLIAIITEFTPTTVTITKEGVKTNITFLQFLWIRINPPPPVLSLLADFIIIL